MTETEVHDLLMADYDRQFPHATEFQRGSFEFEVRKILGRLYRLNLIVTNR